MKITVINQPLANRGDEAAHKAFLRTLAKQYKDAQIDVLFINKKEELIDPFNVHLDNVNYINLVGGQNFIKVEAICLLLRFPRLALLYPVLNRFYKNLKAYDIVINAPGGICMGGFRNWDHVWQLLMAKYMKKKILYWGRSIGPFTDDNYKNRIFKNYSIELLRYFSFCGLRESKSVAIAKSLGVEVTEMIDPALMEETDAEIPNVILNEIGNSKYFVFVPNELTWQFMYKDVPQETIDCFYLEIFKLMLSIYPDYKIVMLPQTYKSVIRDVDYFCKLKEKVQLNNIVVVDENQNSDIQQQIIKNSEMVIGARYHSIVFAINNQVPFIALSYEHKMIGLLEKLNISHCIVDIQELFTKGEDKEVKQALERIGYLLKNNFVGKFDFRKINKDAFSKLISNIVD